MFGRVPGYFVRIALWTEVENPKPLELFEELCPPTNNKPEEFMTSIPLQLHPIAVGTDCYSLSHKLEIHK